MKKILGVLLAGAVALDVYKRQVQRFCDSPAQMNRFCGRLLPF